MLGPYTNNRGTEQIPRFKWDSEAHTSIATDDVSARSLLQRATQDALTEKGLDVSSLTDNQLSDSQFYL